MKNEKENEKTCRTCSHCVSVKCGNQEWSSQETCVINPDLPDSLTWPENRCSLWEMKY